MDKIKFPCLKQKKKLELDVQQPKTFKKNYSWETKMREKYNFMREKKDKSPDCQKDVGVHVEQAEERKNPSG